MIEYTNSLDAVAENMLDGFFVGWPSPPTKASHMRILKGSCRVWLAVDTDKDRIVGFINAISDGVLSAYIPLLEVLPEYQKTGIGRVLVHRMLHSLQDLYMVDLLCDPPLQTYYEKLGMQAATGVCVRNYSRQSGK